MVEVVVVMGQLLGVADSCCTYHSCDIGKFCALYLSCPGRLLRQRLLFA